MKQPTEAETREVDDEMAARCRGLAIRVLRGLDDGSVRLAVHALGLTLAGAAALAGMPTSAFVALADRHLPEANRRRLAVALRDADSVCTHCGATWWPPELELCKWCGEPAEEQSHATVNGRAQPQDGEMWRW